MPARQSSAPSSGIRPPSPPLKSVGEKAFECELGMPARSLNGGLNALPSAPELPQISPSEAAGFPSQSP